MHIIRAVIALSFLCVSAFATSPSAVTIDASLGNRSDLVVTVVSHSDRVSRAVLDVTAAGELFSLSAPATPIDLPAELPVTVHLPLDLHPGGDFGTVTVQLLQRDGDPVHAQDFHFTRAGATARRVSLDTYTATVRTVLEERQETSLTARARALLQATIARGQQPVATSGAVEHLPGVPADDTPFERAWNRVVAEYHASPAKPVVSAAAATAPGRSRATRVSGSTNRLKPAPQTCSAYYDSPDNHSYPVYGLSTTYDIHQYYGFNRPLQHTGYTGYVVTYVKVENDCEMVQYRTRSFYYTTGSGGSFQVTASTKDDPATTNPILDVVTIAPDVGELNCPQPCTTVTPGQVSLYGSNTGWQANASAIYLSPYYTVAQSPDRFYLYWSDEIASLKAAGTPYGFSSYSGSFVAGHEKDAGLGFRAGATSGTVVFGDNDLFTTPFLIDHELGHFFQYLLQNHRLGGGGPHSACDLLEEGSAFREGFADWHGAFFTDIGRSSFVPCLNGECFSCSTSGYRRELNVAAFFWDLFDDVNDASSDQSLDIVGPSQTGWTPNKLLAWTSFRDYTSFDDFYADFLARSQWGNYQTTTQNLRVVNKVDVSQ